MKFDDFQTLEAPFLFMIQEILQVFFTDNFFKIFRIDSMKKQKIYLENFFNFV